MNTRSIRIALLLATMSLLAACGGFLEPGKPTVWYQLEDRSAASRTSQVAMAVTAPDAGAPPARAEPPATATTTTTVPTARPRLMLSPLQSGALYESTGIVFGRSADMRAYYQYANWAERPTTRLVNLLDARLNARLRDQPPEARQFAWVAQDTSGLIGDWLLGLRIRDFFHDASTGRDRAVVHIDVELINWQAKSLLARREFRIEEVMAGSNATAAVAALSSATSRLLDQIADWLATEAPAPSFRGGATKSD